MDQIVRTLPVNSPELLAPGGSIEKCRIALLYGADAVYAAGQDFGLRGFAPNLDTEELAEAVFYAHLQGRKIYVTVNIFARQADLKRLPAYLEYLAYLGVDGLIISDPGVLLLARRHAPRIPIHLSTQANTTNASSVKFWHDQGVSRINLARELELSELAEIAEAAAEEHVEIEMFVHGSMCMSYSGRCLMSAFLNNRSANSGYCTQPCRWSYRLVEEKRPGEYFPVMEDQRGTYILNSKDLCLLEYLDRLTAIGIRSFKIEGRMKGALYLAGVTRSYRQALDRCVKSPGTFRVESAWLEDLHSLSHRPYTTGMLFQTGALPDAKVEGRVAYVRSHTLAGIVRADPEGNFPGQALVQVRSRLTPDQRLEFMFPDGSSKFHTPGAFHDLVGNSIREAHPNGWIRFPVDFPVFPLQVLRTPQ